MAISVFRENKGVILKIVAAPVQSVRREEKRLDRSEFLNSLHGILGTTGAHGTGALAPSADEFFISGQEPLGGNG